MPSNDQNCVYTKIITENGKQKYVCKSTGFEYVPDAVRHVYGVSTRKPLEEMFLGELDFFHKSFPGYEIFTLGSSTVLGERFIMYLTICEFKIETEDAFGRLEHALRESDQTIRHKLGALWKWDITARKGLDIAFMVGHMDFAYFLQHRKEFAKHAHSRYMSSFTTERTVITSKDFKILHDGRIVPFDQTKLDAGDRFIFESHDKINFEYVAIDEDKP